MISSTWLWISGSGGFYTVTRDRDTSLSVETDMKLNKSIGGDIMKLLHKYIIGLLLAFTVVTSHAATVDISVDPASTTVVLGDSFTVDIIGNYGGGGSLLGGALDLIFDPLVLKVTGVMLIAPDTVGGGLGSGAIDNNIGRVDKIGFSDFFGVVGNFTLATINLTAVGLGTNSILQLEDAQDPILSWSNDIPPFGEAVIPNFTGGTVTVSAVPIPAAGWLLASGIGFLGFFRRRVSS